MHPSDIKSTDIQLIVDAVYDRGSEAMARHLLTYLRAIGGGSKVVCPALGGAMRGPLGGLARRHPAWQMGRPASLP